MSEHHGTDRAGSGEDVLEEDTVVETLDAGKLERRELLEKPLAVGERGGVAATDDERADEHREPVDQVRREKRVDEFAPALDHHLLEPPGFEALERRRQVDAILARADDLRTCRAETVGPRLVGPGGREQHRRGVVGENPGVVRCPEPGVGDDAGGVRRVTTRLAVRLPALAVDCQRRVVRENGPDTDDDRVTLCAQRVDAVEIRRTADRDLLARPRRELAVDTRRGVHDYLHTTGSPR